MKKTALFLLLAAFSSVYGQLSYPPAAGMEGSTAIAKDSPVFVGWASGITVERGYIQASDITVEHMGSNKATYGIPEDALGLPDNGAVSLGDAGVATVMFDNPVKDGEGFDFAVFENGTDTFLELAFVEVSSDGMNFFRFPSHSETQTVTPIGGFGALDARNLNNLAGKYRVDFGTPFDLSELPNDALLDKNAVTHIRIIDVVGSIDPVYATYDSYGNKVQDPFPTPFYSSGFDLAGIGIIHQGTLGNEEFSQAQFQMYPNPATENLYLKTEGRATVCLYDMSGRRVAVEEADGEAHIPVASLEPGIYLVEVTIGSRKTSEKLIIK